MNSNVLAQNTKVNAHIIKINVCIISSDIYYIKIRDKIFKKKNKCTNQPYIADLVAVCIYKIRKGIGIIYFDDDIEIADEGLNVFRMKSGMAIVIQFNDKCYHYCYK